MSVTFSAYRLATRPDHRRVRVNPGTRLVDSACLCAQMASTWDMYLEGTDLEELRSEADSACVLCGGTGVSPIEEGGIEINLCNLNAAAFLTLLGFEVCEHLIGKCTVATARRALMGARARFDRVAPGLVREGVELVSPRRVATREDGVLELVGGRLRGVTGSLELEDLRGYVRRFSMFVELVARHGATHIVWG